MLLAFALLILAAVARGELAEHTYEVGEDVILFVNKVGPPSNPNEIYGYYTLPYCPPDDYIESPLEGLGEALQGYELIESRIKFRFQQDEESVNFCSTTLDDKSARAFRSAIRSQYWYQLFCDDLPIWGVVGDSFADASKSEKSPPQQYIYTHRSFVISYNGPQVIEVNLTSDNPVLVKPGADLDFTYSTQWVQTDIKFEHRFKKYLDEMFFEHQIHWFSIFNSFMMVVFLAGLVSMILMRTLKRDFARFGADIDEEADAGDVAEEVGWKQISGDVFRTPQNLELFSTLLGTGMQLAVLVPSVLCLSFFGAYYEDRGTMLTALIVMYALTSFVGGYASGSFYVRHAGKNWIRTMMYTWTLLPAIVLGTGFMLHIVSVSYRSLSYIPVPTQIAVVAIWVFVSGPLIVAGTVFGRNFDSASKQRAPQRVNQVPRPVPEREWYLEPWVGVALCGVLPFGSIFIELYFVFTSFWHHKHYYVYGFMFIVFMILLIVTVCVTIVNTYFLLNAEDHRWQWTSFFSGASTSLYVFFYIVYYFVAKTRMTGVLQTAFYFGYMSCFCVALAIMGGAIGYYGASAFVHRIYSHKID